VNGVKQVIIVPLALPSNDVSTISSSTFLPLSSSSAVSIDSRPDDVKLLAEACVPVVTSSTVPSFVKAEVLSAATNSHIQVFAVSTNPTSAAPSPYQLFGTSHLPCTNSLVAAQQLHVNSVRNRQMPLSTITPYPSPSVPAVSTLPAPILPLCGFPPARHVTTDRFIEQRSTVPLPIPPQQPFPVSFSLYRPLQLNSGLNSFRHMLPSMVTQAVPYSSVQMGSTCGRITNTSLNNFYPLSQPSFDSSLTSSHVTNYQHFLPSLQRAVTPNFPGNQPQLQQYLVRKRGIYPQYSAQGLPLDAGNYCMPQFDPNFLPNNGIAQKPLPVNANDMRAVYRNMPHPSRGVISSYRLQSNLNSCSSNISKPHLMSTQLPNNGVLHSVVSAVCQMTESGGASVRRRGTTDQLCRDQINGNRPHLVSSQLSHTGISHPALSALYQMAESRGITIMPKESEQALSSSQLLCCQPVASIPIDVNPAQSTTLQTTVLTAPTAALSAYVTETTNMRVFPQISTASSYFQHVPHVPSDLQVTVNPSQPMSVPAVAIATPSLRTVTTYATETNYRPAAAVQISATVKSNLTKHSVLEALLCNVSSDITLGSVPSNCSLTSDPSLSNLLSTSVDLLFSSTSASVANADRDSVTESSVVQNGTGMGMEMVSSQSGDNSNDLGSLPADVMVETTESESLLMSFCDLFERSDTAHQHLEGVSSRPMSDTDKDSLINAERPKDSNVGVNQQKDERALQFAKSLGKGRHFAEELNKKRRRSKLTSLEVDDEGNSSDSWHPDSHSESSEYQSPSPAPSYESSNSRPSSHSESSENQTPTSPAHSTESSKSQSSGDFVASSRQSRKRQKTHSKSKRKMRSLCHVACAAKKRRNSAVLISPCAVTKKCTVLLEQLQLQGQHCVNVHHIDRLICCQRHNIAETAARQFVSSESESSTADCPPIKKLRIKTTRCIIEHSDSSS